MATLLTTGEVTVPDQVFEPWLGKIKYGSSVATLSGAIPMKFGAGSSLTIDTGEAEYVGEGQNKGPSDISALSKRITPKKFHKTVRWTEEVQWADEDHQLDVLDQILAQLQPALSRALDFGVYHGTNPTGAARVSEMGEALDDTTKTTAPPADGPPYAALDAADALVLADSYVPSGIALSPAYAATFSSARTTDGVKLYPDLALQTAPASNLDGHQASVSDTVSTLGRAGDGTRTASNVSAYVGDFSGIRWGVQRQIPLELIQYGDPDGQGDLKRNNQVAFRMEIVYGWGIADLDAFAKIAPAAA